MKRGFTLVELLAVIVILAVILAIAIPSISNIINSSRLNSFNISSKMLKEATKTYLSVNNISVTNGTTTQILYSDIKDAGYISNIIDPISKNECINSKVYITNAGGTYTYKGALVCDNYMDIDVYNLVTNGDFSNGTVNWSNCMSCTTQVANNELSLLVNSQYSGIVNPFTGIIGHIIYFRANIKADSANANLKLNDGTPWTSTNSKFVTTVGSYAVLKGTTTLNTTSSYIKIQDDRSSGWTNIYVKDCFAFDLTAIYGAGNEPTQSQMNNIMINMGK
jgi:type IV pilus assembly protein PilA